MTVVPAFMTLMSGAIFVFACMMEREVAWHRRGEWRDAPPSYWRERSRSRRHWPRIHPEHIEYDPRLDPILSVVRRGARIVCAVSGGVWLLLVLFGG